MTPFGIRSHPKPCSFFDFYPRKWKNMQRAPVWYSAYAAQHVPTASPALHRSKPSLLCQHSSSSSVCFPAQSSQLWYEQAQQKKSCHSKQPILGTVLDLGTGNGVRGTSSFILRYFSCISGCARTSVRNRFSLNGTQMIEKIRLLSDLLFSLLKKKSHHVHSLNLSHFSVQ